jgi:hypothetical protein
MFKEEDHRPKREQVKQLFNDLSDVNDRISNLRIEILWTDTKL